MCRLDHTGTGVFVGDVREITGEHVVAYVAAIAVDVGGAETEGIAVVAGGAFGCRLRRARSKCRRLNRWQCSHR